MATIKKTRAIKTYENGSMRFATLVQGKGLNNFEKIFPLLPPEYEWLCLNAGGEVWAYIDKPVEEKHHCQFSGQNKERGILVGTGFDGENWNTSLVHESNANIMLLMKTKAINKAATASAQEAKKATEQKVTAAAVSDLFFMIGSHTQDDDELDWSAAQFVELMQTLGHDGLDVESVITNYKSRA